MVSKQLVRPGMFLLARCLIVALVTCSLVGCTEFGEVLWPWSGPYSDTVPGCPSPAERAGHVRQMGVDASSADSTRQETIARQLATGLHTEEDPILRAEIARALGSCRTPTAVGALEMAMRDEHLEVRWAACKSLGRLGGPQATAMLAQAVHGDVDLDVRMAAVEALGNTGEQDAIGPLGVALEDADPAMQLTAIKSLEQISGKDMGNNVAGWRQYVQTHSRPPNNDAVQLAERP